MSEEAKAIQEVSKASGKSINPNFDNKITRNFFKKFTQIRITRSYCWNRNINGRTQT